MNGAGQKQSAVSTSTAVRRASLNTMQGSLGSGVVSLTISHRSEWQTLLNALASLFRNTTMSSGWNATTKSLVIAHDRHSPPSSISRRLANFIGNFRHQAPYEAVVPVRCGKRRRIGDTMHHCTIMRRIEIHVKGALSCPLNTQRDVSRREQSAFTQCKANFLTH
jgi:hypothetical protein